MTLFIDTIDFNAVMFALAGEKVVKRSYKIDPHKSHESLGKLEAFLKSAKVNIPDIKKIVVNKGPGSYTGVRVGLAHAQALSLAWNVPVRPLAKARFYEKLMAK
jgi:tRNA threonylcarbamoyladenosine biosynthesis protein TsaB